jgi:xanthine dehydrogenase/oxidase
MRPTSLPSLLAIKAKHPDAKLIVGNSEVGIEMKFKAARYPVLVGATHVAELNAVEVGEEGVTFGASTTLSTLMSTCKELIASRSDRTPHSHCNQV